MSIERKASIKLTPGCGPGTEIVVDGVDIASSCRGLSVDARAGQIPRVELDLLIFQLELVGDATLQIPAETRAALVVLGWTPPADDQP